MKCYAFLFSATKHRDYDWLILPEFIHQERRFELARKIGFRPAINGINEKYILHQWPIYITVYWRAIICKDNNGNIMFDNFERKLWQCYGVILKSYIIPSSKISEQKLSRLMNYAETEIKFIQIGKLTTKYPIRSTWLKI